MSRSACPLQKGCGCSWARHRLSLVVSFFSKMRRPKPISGFQVEDDQGDNVFLPYLGILPVTLISNRRNAGPVGPTVCCIVGAVCG